jgi:hypothetical protein
LRIIAKKVRSIEQRFNGMKYIHSKSIEGGGGGGPLIIIKPFVTEF